MGLIIMRCESKRNAIPLLPNQFETHCSSTQYLIPTLLDYISPLNCTTNTSLLQSPKSLSFPNNPLHHHHHILFQQTNHTKDRSTFNICVSFSTNPCASLCISAATLCTPASLPCISLSRFTRVTIFSDDSRSVFDNSRSVSSRFARVCDDRTSPAVLRPPRPPDQLTTPQSPRKSAQAFTFSSGTKS